ncbi:hypothetical protein RND71_010602 [Anisodus tanguticus]|uniref:Uncharacterized protein n=1 Tax=Anisodus tanguticus TaxID=243964 RepID=A0AAE1SJV2_9SOLA|nr:hypothetical protein RND71_010602 [Anisodus tanguticus]
MIQKGLKRTGKSCRLRWLNYLKPDVKRGNLSPQEQLLILELHSKWGNRWSKIAEHLPGRTDNEIKNYWRTRVQKQARQLKVDSNSREFLEAIRSFWIPRLLEKMEQCPFLSSSPSSSSCSDITMEKQNSTLPSPLINLNESLETICKESPRFYSSESMSMTENSTTFNGNSVYSNSTKDDCYLCCSNYRILQKCTISKESNRYTSTFYKSPRNLDCYHSEGSSYFEGNFREQPEFSALVESQDMSVSEYEVAEVDWFTDQVAGSLWNIDEFR